jgi:hypothetical protein
MDFSTAHGLPATGARVMHAGSNAVAPSGDLAPGPGPHHVGGSWMTCWEHVAVDHAAPPPALDELGRALQELHAALVQVAVALEPYEAVHATARERALARAAAAREAGGYCRVDDE